MSSQPGVHTSLLHRDFQLLMIACSASAGGSWTYERICAVGGTTGRASLRLQRTPISPSGPPALDSSPVTRQSERSDGHTSATRRYICQEPNTLLGRNRPLLSHRERPGIPKGDIMNQKDISRKLDEDDDVQGHRLRHGGADAESTEGDDDVEGHRLRHGG